MVEAGAVAFSDDGLPVSDGQVFRLACEYAKMFGVPVINHAEDPRIRKNGVMHEGTVSAKIGLAGNPDVAESSMVNRDLELSVLTGTHLHVPHVSAEKSVQHLRKTLEFSKSISSEVTPHHLYFNHESLHSFDTSFKVAPPIRGEKDRLALISAVKEGIITCIATDHAPHTLEEKSDTYLKSPSGGPLIQFSLPLLLQLNHQNKIKLEDIVQKTSHNLSTLFQIKDRGYIREGYYADLVLFDLDTKTKVSEEVIHSKCGWSPLKNETFNSRVMHTIVSGNHIYNNGKINGEPESMRLEFERD